MLHWKLTSNSKLNTCIHQTEQNNFPCKISYFKSNQTPVLLSHEENTHPLNFNWLFCKNSYDDRKCIHIITCVAQITGFPALLQRPIIIFWARKTYSVGISIPRSPRATIIPSAALIISSKLKINNSLSLTDFNFWILRLVTHSYRSLY